MAGHISIFFTAHCGICTETFTSSEDGLPNFRRYLRTKGWKNTRKHSWQCPACQQSEVEKARGSVNRQRTTSGPKSVSFPLDGEEVYTAYP